MSLFLENFFNENGEKEYTTQDLCSILSVTRQNILHIYREGRLKGEERYNLKIFKGKDVADYLKNRWSRKGLRLQGELVYNPKEGLISLKEGAAISGLEYMCMYNLIKNHGFPHTKKGCHYVLKIEDVLQLKKLYTPHKKGRVRMSEK